MKTKSLIAAAIAFAGTSAAQSVSQTVSFDYDAALDVTLLDIEAFDTMGGTRQLDRATFTFEHNFALDVFVESTGPTALSADDYQVDIGYISILQLGLADDNGDDDDNAGGPPFFGPGAFFTNPFSEDLDAYNNIPGDDAGDSFSRLFTESYTSRDFVFERGTEQSTLDAITDTGTLTSVYGGFTELNFFWINNPGWPPAGGFFPDYPNDAAVWVDIQSLRHFGQFTVVYDYTLIPAPATAPLAMLALGAAARRRTRDA